MTRGHRRADTEGQIEIDTRYAAERWPYLCPSGHIDWQATSDGFVCPVCENNDSEGAFTALLDRRSGERIPRGQVKVGETGVAAAYEVGSRSDQRLEAQVHRT